MSYDQHFAQGAVLENRYRIRGVLGQGGMSRVYLAKDARLGTRVAVKENLQTTPEARAQFEREARLLASLSHPNLPRVTDHFVDPRTGCQYLVMDYVEGEDLETMIKRVGALPETTALAWIKQILSATEYLHSQHPPVIHRDIKPANIKITPEGKAVLVDFGIAKSYDPRSATLTGARAVTPGYAPPEQYGMRTTERSDIYGLGATLYTMLTARVPPEAPLRQAAEEKLFPPSQFAHISPQTENSVLRALNLESTRRWHTVAEFRIGLEGLITLPSPERPKQRMPNGIIAVSILALVCLAIIALYVSSAKGVALQAQATMTARAMAAGTLAEATIQAEATQLADATHMAQSTLSAQSTREVEARLTATAATDATRNAQARLTAIAETDATLAAQARANAFATAQAEATSASEAAMIASATAFADAQTATTIAELPVMVTVINHYRDMQDIWVDDEFFLRVELRTTASATISRGVHTFVICWRGDKPPDCGDPWTRDIQRDYSFTISEE